MKISAKVQLLSAGLVLALLAGCDKAPGGGKSGAAEV